MADKSMARPTDQALVSDQACKSSLDPSGFDPSRELTAYRLGEAVEQFVRESNQIEGIELTSARHYSAHWQFLRGAIHIPALVELVSHLQPDARFRNQPQVPGVRVGSHIAPPSGPDIETNLRRILAIRDPWEQHVAYETLHPFTDGNGRSGRALWLHRFFHEQDLDPWAVRRGFLHSFYYHTLSSVRPRDTDRSGEAGQTAKQAGPKARAGAAESGIAQDIAKGPSA